MALSTESSTNAVANANVKSAATISIKYGDTKYELNIKYLPYLTDKITLTDEQIKKDINEVFNDQSMKLSLLHVVIILNNINWVRHFISMGHLINNFPRNILSPLGFVFENKNNNISFDIAKLIIEKFDYALYYKQYYVNDNITPFDIFYSKKQNKDNWTYITEKCFGVIIDKNFHKLVLSSYCDDNIIKETDPTYKLIYNILEDYIKKNDDVNTNNEFMNYPIAEICKKILTKHKNEKIKSDEAKLESSFVILSKDSKSTQIYFEQIQQLKNDHEVLKKDNNELKKSNDKLKEDIEVLKESNDILTDDNKILKNENKLLLKENNELKSKIDNLKKILI